MRDDAPSTTVTHESRDPRIPLQLLARIRAEYREMPGLCLTAAQAARLWDLTPGVCAEVLQALVAEGALLRTREVYVAAATAPAPRRRARRADGHTAAPSATAVRGVNDVESAQDRSVVG
jgi:hypothetical protein